MKIVPSHRKSRQRFRSHLEIQRNPVYFSVRITMCMSVRRLFALMLAASSLFHSLSPLAAVFLCHLPPPFAPGFAPVFGWHSAPNRRTPAPPAPLRLRVAYSPNICLAHKSVDYDYLAGCPATSCPDDPDETCRFDAADFVRPMRLIGHFLIRRGPRWTEHPIIQHKRTLSLLSALVDRPVWRKKKREIEKQRKDLFSIMSLILVASRAFVCVCVYVLHMNIDESRGISFFVAQSPATKCRSYFNLCHSISVFLRPGKGGSEQITSRINHFYSIKLLIFCLPSNGTIQIPVPQKQTPRLKSRQTINSVQ